MPTPSARPHSKTLFRGTVEMPQKALCGEFYQPTCHVSVLRVSSVQRPLQRVCGRAECYPDFAETLQGILTPSAVLYRKSAVEYLMNSVDFVEQDYSKNCGFISSFGLGFLPFLPSVDSCGRYRQ